MVQAEVQQHYHYGTGKRKCAIARVRLYADDPGPMIVNGKPSDEYFNWEPWQVSLNQAFLVTDTVNRFRVVAKVTGGSTSSVAACDR